MRRIFLIAGGVIVAAVAGLLLYSYLNPAPPPAAPPEAEEQVPLTVSAEGVLIPAATTALGFNTSGRVSRVLVRDGDRVTRGDVLARLDDHALLGEIDKAKKAFIVARARLSQLQAGASPGERTAAQARLDAALKNHSRVRAGPTRQDLAALQAQRDNTLSQLKQAQAAYDRIGGATNPEIGMLPQSAQLEQAANNYNAALAALEDAQQHPTTSELAAAWAEVVTARSIVEKLHPTAAAVAVAVAEVDQAQAVLDALLDNRNEYLLTAPYDGVITEKNLEIGNIVSAMSGSPAFVLADMSTLQVETTDLAEVDVPRVTVGQTATFTLDAFPEKTFHGRVTRIAPAASDHRGDKVFTVWLELEQGTEAGLRPGMTVQVEIDATAVNPG